jgi:putative SOS response-associated peptidase YedK
MCGRYTLTTDLSFLQARFGFEVEEVPFAPRYNISPTQDVVTVVNNGSRNQGCLMRWGLVPFWAKDPTIGNRMINARAETVVENRVFRQVFPKQRCLVVADSFYEWRKNGKSKIPMRIMLKSGEPFAFAGLWSTWRPKGDLESGPLYSCTIITTVPNALMEPIHSRMPVILTPEAEAIWLDTGHMDTAELRELLLPYPAAEMRVCEVSTLVNSPRNNDPRCIEPVSPDADRQGHLSL